MFRRVVVSLFSLCFVFAYYLPIAQATGPEAPASWKEGAHLWATTADHWEPYPTVEHVDLWIIKNVDMSQPGKAKKTSTMFLELWGPDVPNRVILLSQNYLPVPNDPDWVSSSRDLGWGGIDTQVRIPDKTTGENLLVEIHISWWATGGTIQAPDGSYQRPARVTGRIVVSGPRGFRVDFPNHYRTYAYTYIFSTREPKPRY